MRRAFSAPTGSAFRASSSTSFANIECPAAPRQGASLHLPVGIVQHQNHLNIFVERLVRTAHHVCGVRRKKSRQVIAQGYHDMALIFVESFSKLCDLGGESGKIDVSNE